MSWIEEEEEIVDIVSDWAVEIVMNTLKALGNRPFGVEEKSIEQQLQEYLPLRNDPTAWFNYITGKAEDLMNQLKSNGVPDDEMVAISPFNIVVNHLVAWAVKMESFINTKATILNQIPQIPPPQTTPPPGYTQAPPPQVPAPVALQ